MKIEYNSNNSGGSWWLRDEDWRALEVAGWAVEWVKDRSPDRLARGDENGRWLGALATTASKDFNRAEDAVAEWESITGACASDEGCNCCGPPHSFSYRDDEGRYHYTTVTVTETELDWS